MSGAIDLKAIAARTLASYDGRAEAFWAGTRDHDVSQNRAALLRWLPMKPAVILDFGCGPGRDLKAFRDDGHIAIGLDGAPNFVEMARAHSGCEVWLQDFLRLGLPPAHFDGVFANASLFHVPAQELPRVLRELHATLKPGGALFMSNPRGTGEGWRGDRYGAHRELEDWRAFLDDAGFTELEHYYRPSDAPPEEQFWLAGVWRR
jgi:SAM-dependent methyltransferase